MESIAFVKTMGKKAEKIAKIITTAADKKCVYVQLFNCGCSNTVEIAQNAIKLKRSSVVSHKLMADINVYSTITENFYLKFRFFLAICYIIERKSNVCSHIHKQKYIYIYLCTNTSKETETTDFRELFAEMAEITYFFATEKKKKKMRLKIEFRRKDKSRWARATFGTWMVGLIFKNYTFAVALKYHMWALAHKQIHTYMHARAPTKTFAPLHCYSN